MRISMQILADRVRQNYPDCLAGELSDEMNLKRPLFYQGGASLRKNKVYIAHESDLTEEILESHGDNLLLVVEEAGRKELEPPPGVIFFREDCDPEVLFNTVQRAFDTYDAWDERMQSMALSENTMKTLLDASYRIFHNPIMVTTKEGFVVDHSSLMDSVAELQNMLQNSRVPEEVSDGSFWPVQRCQDPESKRNSLFVEIYDKNRNAYRVILLEISRRLKTSDEYLLLHLSKYIEQMVERFTVVQPDVSYTLDRLLSNVLTDDKIEKSSLCARFQSFHWEEGHCYFCMNIHVSTIDRQNLTVIRFLCNRIEGLIKGSCAFFMDERIVVCVNLSLGGTTLDEALHAVTGFLKDSYLKAGISYAFTGLGAMKQYYLQSRIALEEGMKRYPLRWVNRFEDIALDYLMGKCTELLEPEVVCSRAVLTLREYDREHKTDYYETLRTYISCQMNAVQAAKTLFIHRSTFLYRMAHIKELIQIDLDDPNQLLYLLLTYRLLEPEEERSASSDSDSHSS
ncbi:MAG: helix-turn-helix domain-containing protein [Lachnospiraceae bacterium]|nr:helix-turn-helix domain-containing protein [Lachnospiraceae bacterium]